MPDPPKIHRRHGFYVLVMVVGWVLPPVAVLLRFGFGTDFLLNILLTLCGYIPGHGHNFYLQNIRNNDNRKRTPKWATRAGLVKDKSAKRKVKTQWANRYDERTPTRADGYQDDDHLPSSQNHQDRPSTLDPHITERTLTIDSNDHHDRLTNSNRIQDSSTSISKSSTLEARDLDRISSSSLSAKKKKDKYEFENYHYHHDNNDLIRTGNRNKILRRKTSHGTHHQDRSSSSRDYFVRRSSSVSGPASFNNPNDNHFSYSHNSQYRSKPDQQNHVNSSASATKSFSQFFGLDSKKSLKKNRFDLSNEARSQWNNHSPSRSKSNKSTIMGSAIPESNDNDLRVEARNQSRSLNSNHHVDPDGLNHQF